MQNKLIKFILAAAAATVLSACGNMNSVNSQGEITTPQVKWGNIQKTTFKTNGDQPGMWKSKADLDLVQKGMNKAQAYELLGRPHYNEGFAPREWNYVVNKNTPEGVKHCQLKLLFNKDWNVANYMWYPADCMVETPKEAPVVQKPIEKFNLRADFLFAFDKAELSTNGVQELTRVASAIQQHDTVKDVTIVGHTDRLGSDAYNKTLSEKRAMTVANFLIGKGVAPYKMRAYGAGEAYPVKDCAGEKPTDELKACLIDNRRVEISVQ